VRKMQAQNVKMERVTLVGKGRENVTCFVYYMYEIIVKYFYLGDVWGGGVVLHLDKCIFSVSELLYLGFVLDLSCHPLG
jgi:hypothetical protein